MNLNILKLISAILLAAAFCGCGKEKNKNKEWVFYIDGIECRSVNVKGSYVEGNSRLSVTDKINGKNISVIIMLNQSFFPQSGVFPMKLDQDTPLTSSIGVSINDSTYLRGRKYQANVIAGSENGKAKYTIEPIWLFTQYESNGVLLESTDSVLFWGTAYEPESVTVRE